MAQDKIKILEAELLKTRTQAEQLAQRLAALEADLKKAPDAKKVADPKKGADAKPGVKIIRLKNASAEALAKILQMTFAKSDVRIVPDPATNSLLLTGPDEGVLEIAQVITELDRDRGKE